MKILQVIHKPQNRGAEIFASQLSNHLVALGHQVKIVAVFQGDANLPFKGEIISLKASSKFRFFDFKAWKRLSNIINEFQPQVVQANAGDTLKYVIFSKVLFRWKVPVVSRNASEIGRYLNSSLQKKLNSFLYKKVDKVISVSKASKKDILKHFAFLKDKTEVIPVGLEKGEVEDEKVELEPLEKKNIVHVGGFTFEKNHEGLLRIFRAILKKDPNVQLHLLGDGPLRPSIEKKAEEMDMTTNVCFYGFVDNPLSYIKAADVLILPSIIEGLPGVLLEAMYCDVPVVAYNVGGISEIVTRDTGNLILKDDEAGFTQAVLEVLNEPENQQIQNAKAMVVGEYMNDQIALKFVNSYQNLVAQQQ